MTVSSLLSRPPDLACDISWSAFSVTFPRRKPWPFAMHRAHVAEFRFFAKAFPGPNFSRGLRQWSESFAELVGRN